MIIMRERTAGAMASSRDAVAVAESGCEDWKVRVEIGGGEMENRSRELMDFHWSKLGEGLASEIVGH